jgi:hypothetical protein
MHSYVLAGNDPIVGRRLVELLRHAGATPVRNTWVFFGGCAGEPIWPLVVANLIGVVDGARADLARTGLADSAIDDALEEVRTWSAKPGAAIWYAIALAEGLR